MRLLCAATSLINTLLFHPNPSLICFLPVNTVHKLCCGAKADQTGFLCPADTYYYLLLKGTNTRIGCPLLASDAWSIRFVS